MAKIKTTKAQLRNLPQYKNLSEEDLDKVLDKILYGDYEYKIQEVIEKFEQDYDLSDMTANDQLALLELARIFILAEFIQSSVNILRKSLHLKISHILLTDNTNLHPHILAISVKIDSGVSSEKSDFFMIEK